MGVFRSVKSTLDNKYFFLSKIVFYLLLFISTNIFAAQSKLASIDEFLKLSLEDLLNTPITSTSYFPETALDVAATVTVIPKQSWEKRGARRLNDAIINMPSVVALPNFLAQDSIRIRGYAQRDARGIATLWDGVSITSFNLGTTDIDRPNVQLNTLDSIEVIRGPGSSLYGSDAFHGVVSLNSFESDENINLVKARAASNGFYEAGYNSSVNLGKNWRVNVSLASSGQSDQGIAYSYVGGTGERDFNFESNTFVAKLSSDASKTWSYKFGIYYDGNDSNDFHGHANVLDKDVASVDAQLTMFKFYMNYQISKNSSLSLETYTWDQHHVFQRPFSATEDVRINGDEHREAAKLVYRNSKLTENTEFSAAIAVRHDKVDLQHTRRFNITTLATVADSDLPYSGTGRKINSFLLDGKTKLVDKRWTLRYGFRLDDYSDFGSQFTPRFGVIYKLDNQSVIKALYGNSFRAAVAAEVGGSSFIAGDPNIKPEELDTYELVYLKQNNNSKVEIVVFSNKWSNGITVEANKFVNLSDNEAYGVEATYLKKMDEWTLETSASYVKSESKTDNSDFIAFPKYILNLGLGYDFSSDWALFVNNRVHLDAYEGPTATNKLKEYWRVDMNLTKSFKNKWQFFANIRNILNRENYLPSLVNTDGGIPENEISIDVGITYQL